MTQDNRLLTEEKLREDLAELEHIQWIEWASTLEQAEELSPARIERWHKLFKPYSELTEEQKDQDRIWADKAIALFTTRLEEAHDKGFKEGVEKTTDACNSTFGSMMEEAKKQTAEEIKRELEGKYQLPGNGIYRTLIYGGDVYVNSESWQKFCQRRVGE